MPSSLNLAEGVRVVDGYLPLSDGVALRVVEFSPPGGGEHQPPVVFLPGWISSMGGWRPVLEVLTARHPVIYVETREKITAKLPSGVVDFSVDRLTADLHEILEAKVPPDRDFCFMGSSFGSTVILDYMSRGARQPLLAIAIAPNVIFRLPFWVLPLARVIPMSFYRPFKQLLKWYLTTFLLDRKREPEQVERYQAALDAAEPERLHANARALNRYSGWEILPRVTAPVLIIAGESDKLHHRPDMERMVAVMPNARLELMESNRATHSELAGEMALDVIERVKGGEPLTSRPD